ncbi:MAG: Di-glucose binding within endoplasmic reticulum, partial [Candidatus Poribacteria bacterium]|nr:Di-glucose binding within endoplasmic reticulum [Candidatus Poribacteria bacterium]
YDQALYQTARISKTIRYVIPVSPGIYTVHLKFAELWQKEPGQRPMNIEINGKLFWKAWDPATVAGQVGMAIDLRAENITPDKDGQIILVISSAGENEAILQGLEIE